MRWVLGTLGGAVLMAVGVTLRRLLHLGEQATRRPVGLVPLSADREAVYRPVALEVEAQAAILGISLNDAIEERDFGNHEIAWRLVWLAACEWDQLASIVAVLLNTVSTHMPVARLPLPVRDMVAHRFKSRIMIDYVRVHELLDQLVFRSKLRFQLHIRVLRRAVETLTAEFRRTHRYAQQTQDRSLELWSRLDLYFHDLDLVAKETLLALRAFLASLPEAALADFAADLRILVCHGVRTTSSLPASRSVS